MTPRRSVFVAQKITYKLSLDEQIADYLKAFWPALPPKHIQMRQSGPKYSWVKADEAFVPLTYADLLSHAAGEKTIGAYLHDALNLARVGALDIDDGGHDALRAGLAAARQLGFTAYAIHMPGETHDGGRLVVEFAVFIADRDIRAVMEKIRDTAGLPEDTEIWPGSQNGLGLPFGYHVRKKTRGTLITQDGECFQLDQSDQRQAALRAIPPANPAPPKAPEPPKVEQPAICVKTHSPSRTTTAPAPRRSNGKIDTAAIGRAVREHFNDITDWSNLLSDAGGHEMRDGWACNCGEAHEHDTQIAITSQDKIVSYSTHCAWAPHRDSGRALDKFGFYVDQVHGGNYRAAVECKAREYGLWVEPTPRRPRQEAPTAPEMPEWQTSAAAERRRQDAERKRQERQAARAERVARIDALCELLDQDARIYPFARDIFAFHLSCWASGPEHYQSIERITRAVIGLDRTPTEAEYRRVQIAHKRLIDAHYLLRTIRTDPGRRNTNCWQPGLGATDGYRVIRTAETVAPQQDAENGVKITLIESSTDLTYKAKELVSGAHEPSPLDTWAWCEAAHGADELAFLDAPEDEPLPVLLPPEAPYPASELAIDDKLERLALACYARNLAATMGETLDPEPLSKRPQAEIEQVIAALEVRMHVPADVADPYTVTEWYDESAPRFTVTLWTTNGAFGLPGEYQTLEDARAAMPPRLDEPEQLADGSIGYTGGAWYSPIVPEAPEVEQPANDKVLIQLDPLVQAPPLASESAYREFIWRYRAAQPGVISSRTKKPYSQAQRARFKRDYEALLVDVSPAEAALRWESLTRPASVERTTARGRGAPLTSSRAAVPPVAQQQAFSTA